MADDTDKADSLLKALDAARQIHQKLLAELETNSQLQGSLLRELTWARVGRNQVSIGRLSEALYDVKDELGYIQSFGRDQALRVYGELWGANNGVLN